MCLCGTRCAMRHCGTRCVMRHMDMPAWRPRLHITASCCTAAVHQLVQGVSKPGLPVAWARATGKAPHLSQLRRVRTGVGLGLIRQRQRRDPEAVHRLRDARAQVAGARPRVAREAHDRGNVPRLRVRAERRLRLAARAPMRSCRLASRSWLQGLRVRPLTLPPAVVSAH